MPVVGHRVSEWLAGVREDEGLLNPVGVQVQVVPPDFDILARTRARVLKMFNPFANVDACRRVKALSDGQTLIDLRLADGDQDYHQDASRFADQVMHYAEPFVQAGVIDFIEHYNEQGYT